jgi:hypothetical protein
MQNRLTETIEYANVDEVKEHIGDILDEIIRHRFGRCEIIVVDGKPTQIEERLTYKLKRIRLRKN